MFELGFRLVHVLCLRRHEIIAFDGRFVLLDSVYVDWPERLYGGAQFDDTGGRFFIIFYNYILCELFCRAERKLVLFPQAVTAVVDLVFAPYALDLEAVRLLLDISEAGVDLRDSGIL